MTLEDVLRVRMKALRGLLPPGSKPRGHYEAAVMALKVAEQSRKMMRSLQILINRSRFATKMAVRRTRKRYAMETNT